MARYATTPAQPSLFRLSPPFDGTTFDPQRDQARLTGQLERVYDVLRDGDWWTVTAIHRRIVNAYDVRDPEPSISAQIRNLRKARFGGHTIERRHHGGVHQFRLVEAHR